MISAGLVRKIDREGRVSIPIQFRKQLNYKVNDEVEVIIENDKIMIKKWKDACEFCGRTEDVVLFQNKNICSGCMEEFVNESDKH